MNLTIAKEQILNGLQSVQNVVSTRTTLPILSNVLLRAQDNRLELTATDLDVTITCSVEAAVKKWNRIDVLVNNAATMTFKPVVELSLEEWDKVLAVNLRSVFLGMKHELPLMKRSGGGVICNTASVAAITGPGGMSAYAASKHGVHGLTRVAAMENAAHGIDRLEVDLPPRRGNSKERSAMCAVVRLERRNNITVHPLPVNLRVEIRE